MYTLINCLESLNYIVRIQVTEKHEIKRLFFISEIAIEEARRWPEAITIDATYKTNAHKMSLVNIVGTSNVAAQHNADRLQTFAIAGAFVNSETEATYTWIMEELQEAVWPTNENYALPSVFVTDNEQALRNAIESVFPRSQHLLCSWHPWNTMETKFPAGTVDADEFHFRRIEAEILFKEAMSINNEEQYQKAIISFEKHIRTPGYFAKDGATAADYLKNMYVFKLNKY